MCVGVWSHICAMRLHTACQCVNLGCTYLESPQVIAVWRIELQHIVGTRIRSLRAGNGQHRPALVPSALSHCHFRVNEHGVRVGRLVHNLQTAVFEAYAQRWAIFFHKAILPIVPVNAHDRWYVLLEAFETLTHINLYRHWIHEVRGARQVCPRMA